MKEVIKPKTKFLEGEEEIFTLEDNEYLLITAIQDLTKAIKDLTARAMK